MTKSPQQKFEDEFPLWFNDWFNARWPKEHWSSLPSAWNQMKRCAWDGYQFRIIREAVIGEMNDE